MSYQYNIEAVSSVTFCNIITVSVRSQPVDVQCSASLNCTGQGDDLGNITERECCVDNPRGLAYVSREGICVYCVGECAGVQIT